MDAFKHLYLYNRTLNGTNITLIWYIVQLYYAMISFCVKKVKRWFCMVLDKALI